jgi:hypothetical protein
MKNKEMMAVERDGKLELVPLTQCVYCLSHGHMLEQCPEKHDCFMLNGNDQTFLSACGIWFPRFVNDEFVSDPYEDRRRIQ